MKTSEDFQIACNDQPGDFVELLLRPCHSGIHFEQTAADNRPLRFALPPLTSTSYANRHKVNLPTGSSTGRRGTD